MLFPPFPPAIPPACTSWLETLPTLNEFSIDDLMNFPENSGIPKKQLQYVRMNGKFMWKKLCEYQENHGVQVVFCDDRYSAQERALMIFDEVSEILLREQS